MAVNTVQGVSSSKDFIVQDIPQEVEQRLLSLFQGDSLEKGPPQLSSTGAALTDLPVSDPQQQQTLVVFMQGLSEDDRRAALQGAYALLQGITASSEALQNLNAPLSRENMPPALSAGVQSALDSLPAGGDHNQAVQGLLGASLQMAELKLYDIATQMQENLKLKDSLRNQLRDIDAEILDIEEQLAAMNHPDENHKYPVDVGPEGAGQTMMMTKQEAQDYLSSLKKKKQDIESRLATANDLNGLLAFDLQQAQQQQQLCMNTMSSIIKMMHETMKVAINNTRAS